MRKPLLLLAGISCLIALSAFRMKGQADQMKSYYPSGALKAEFPMKDGRLEGQTKWYYESGAVGAILNYRNNRLQGLSRSYYESGRLRKEILHENNLPVGKARHYYEDGTLMNEDLYRDGRLLLRWNYDRSGRIVVCEDGSAHTDTHAAPNPLEQRF